MTPFSNGIKTFTLGVQVSSGSTAYGYLSFNFDNINSLAWKVVTGTLSEIRLTDVESSNSTKANGTFDTTSITGEKTLRISSLSSGARVLKVNIILE